MQTMTHVEAIEQAIEAINEAKQKLLVIDSRAKARLVAKVYQQLNQAKTQLEELLPKHDE